MVRLLLSISILLFSLNGLAETSKGTSKDPDKDASKDIDDEITNSRLRASTGAKSPFSIQTDFAFIGGAIRKPLGPVRPQLSPGIIIERNTKITGNISAKYRFNENNHINLGTGFGITRPGFSEQKSQMENPYLSYSNVFGIGTTQHVFSASLLKYTTSALLEEKLNYELSFFYTYLKTIPESGWQAGLVFLFMNELYSEYTPINEFGPHNTVGLYPFVEYEFNDIYSFRTIYRGGAFYSTRDNFNKYMWDEAVQSLGVGITIDRDLYLYPNIQWVWRDIRGDKTNVSLIANINFNIF